MWLFKCFVCFRRKHILVNIIWQDLPYHYCLGYGKVEIQDVITELIIVGKVNIV